MILTQLYSADKLQKELMCMIPPLVTVYVSWLPEHGFSFPTSSLRTRSCSASEASSTLWSFYKPASHSCAYHVGWPIAENKSHKPGSCIVRLEVGKSEWQGWKSLGAITPTRGIQRHLHVPVRNHDRMSPDTGNLQIHSWIIWLSR